MLITRGSFNIIHDPYAQVCVSNKVKNMNVRVFNLVLKINETRFLLNMSPVSINVN